MADQPSWIYGVLAAPDAKIFLGTGIGLAILQNMQAAAGLPEKADLVNLGIGGALGLQTLLLPELGHPLFCHGATSLLDRPLITLAGAHWAPLHSLSFGRHLAERLAAAGFAVATAADVAETGLRAGRRVFVPRAAGFRWPGLGTAANVGASVGPLLDSLALLADGKSVLDAAYVLR